jgi:serine/threonine protein kinase
MQRSEPACAEILNIDLQALSIVERVHRAGYVLRDLNPNNLMVDTDGRLWLIDLEMIARPGEVVRRAFIVGYAGPEVVEADSVGPAPQQSADLYSLGAVLFHLCSGAETLLESLAC